MSSLIVLSQNIPHQAPGEPSKTRPLSVVNQIDGSLVNLFEGQTAA